MGQGLGQNQRAVVDALRSLEAERGPGWVSPAEVVERMGQPPHAGRANAIAQTLKLIETLEAAERGDPRAAELAAYLKALGIKTTYRAGRSTAKIVPKSHRPSPRGGKGINSARIFAALEARGIVERRPCTGPRSRLRLA